MVKYKDRVPVQIADELRLNTKALPLLGKSFDLLVTLVVASKTHFLTKAGVVLVNLCTGTSSC